MANESLDIIEYELLDISIDIAYELSEEDVASFVREDMPDNASQKEEQPQIVYDVDGIPMGQTMEEIRERETIIANFLSKWRESNSEGKVFNAILHEYIFVRAISIIEAREHCAKSYNSTRALMILDEVLSNASPIKRVPKKSNDKNQKGFSYFLVMIYKHLDIGTIKLTVGVKKNQNKVQYGISALKPDEPLVDYSEFKKSKKKRNPHK